MPAEAKGLKKPPLPLDQPLRLEEDVSLYLAGVGPVRARSAAEELVKNRATALISWGIAGGLIPTLSPGSLVLPETVISTDRTVYQVDLRWHKYLCDRLAGRIDFCTGPLAESEEVLAYSSEKRSLATRTGAVAVDMESAAVALVAQGAKIPFMVIRAIADSVDLTISERLLTAVDIFGQLNLLVLLKVLAGHPLEVVALVRLGRGFRAAQATLARVVQLMGHEWLFRA